MRRQVVAPVRSPASPRGPRPTPARTPSGAPGASDGPPRSPSRWPGPGPAIRPPAAPCRRARWRPARGSPGGAREGAGGPAPPADRAGTGPPGRGRWGRRRRPARRRGSAPAPRGRSGWRSDGARGSGPAAPGWTPPGGCRARSLRAMPCRRRARARDRSFPVPEPGAELGGQLELFGGYGATELLAELAGVVLAGRFRLGVPLATGVLPAGVMRGAVQPSQQLQERCVERRIAPGAADPAGLAEVLERGPAAGTGDLQRRGERLVGTGRLAQRGEKPAQGGVGDSDPGLDALFCGTLGAQAHRPHIALDDLRQAHHTFPLPAAAALHPGTVSAP